MSTSAARRLVGRVAWVTGGGAGIGRATALRLAEEGAAVGVSTLDAGEAEQTGAELAALGVPTTTTVTDLRDPAAIIAAHDMITAALGPVDVLVNNVGVNQPDVGFLQTTDEIWHNIWTTNLMSAVRATRCVLPGMLERRRGSVVNVASVHGLLGFENASAYAASKGAMLAWTRQLAGETGRHGVRVNAVAPGAIMTPLQQISIDAAEDPEEFTRTLAGLHYLPRFGDPEEVAASIAFLASDDASFVTAATLTVEGGAVAKPF